MQSLICFPTNLSLLVDVLPLLASLHLLAWTYPLSPRPICRLSSLCHRHHHWPLAVDVIASSLFSLFIYLCLSFVHCHFVGSIVSSRACPHFFILGHLLAVAMAAVASFCGMLLAIVSRRSLLHLFHFLSWLCHHRPTIVIVDSRTRLTSLVL